MSKKNNEQSQNRYVAERIAEYFLEYWKKQDASDNEIAVLHSGCSSEGVYPDVKPAV